VKVRAIAGFNSRCPENTMSLPCTKNLKRLG